MQSDLVLEIGSSVVRGGFAGESSPIFTLKTSLFRQFDSHASKFREPSYRRRVNQFMFSIFFDYLHVKPRDCRVLIAEDLYSSRNLRELLFSVLFTDLQVKAVSFQPSLYLALIATGCDKGCVIDIGNHESRAIIFHSGRPIISSFQVIPTGVAHARRRFQRMLMKQFQQEDLPSSQNCRSQEKRIGHDIFSSMFERVCCAEPVCEEGFSVIEEDGSVCRLDSAPAVSDVHFGPQGNMFPSGVSIAGPLRSRCLDELVGGLQGDEYDCSNDEMGGLAGLLLACLKASSVNADVRRDSIRHIVFCGGGASIPGLPASVCNVATTKALRDHHPSSSNAGKNYLGAVVDALPGSRIRCTISPFLRSELAWIGGSIFATAKLNSARYVNIEEFHELAAKLPPSVAQQPESHNEINGNEVAAGGPSTESSRVTSGAQREEYVRIPDELSLNPADRRFSSS